MGILTNPKQGRGLFRLIAKYENPLSFLLYVAGVIWMLALAYAPFNAATYFSENALLPGLVERHYSGQKDAAKFAEEALDKLNTYSQSLETIDLASKLPVSWMEKQFRQLGLETYSQNFTVDHPFLETYGRGLQAPTRFIRGNNVYAILRAPRAEGTEAVVMSVPFRTGKPEQVYGSTSHGVALMLSLAKFFRKYTYWSKDIIFLMTEHEEIGMQAWLESYYHVQSDYISSSMMEGRSGALIGAVNLELGAAQVDRLDLRWEGLNGQLPNLDLINTAVRLCRRERVPLTLQQQVDPSPREMETLKGFRAGLGIMLSNMARQASGQPSGVHGLFHKFHVEAVTLQGVSHPGGRTTVNYASLGRVLEGIFRSLNNLLERFHQSFFFYLMAGTERYISIGLYMPPFGLIASVPVIKAIALWIAMFPLSDGSNQREEGKEREQDGESEEQESVQEVKEGDPKDIADNAKESDDSDLSLVGVVPTLMLVVFPGVINYISPTYAMRWCRAFSVDPESAITMALVAFFSGGVFIPIWFKRSLLVRGSAGDWRLLKFLGLLWQAMMLTAVAMLNFSLGFLLATATVPVYALVRPRYTCSRARSLLQMVLILLVLPPVLLLLCLALYVGVTASPDSLLQLAHWSLIVWQRALFTAVVDSYLFGNWMFALCTLAVFPNWLLFWTIFFRSKPDSSS